ncbi:MAG: XTP/dITP diphosphohydrolase, partial [Chthoniobacter sp.]|nr:XTP/dITP diphosphohydrolase [Chthoniobacter sp.]
MTRELLVATHNAGKTREIREILGPSFHVTDLHAHPTIKPALETGATFEENAGLKALEASRVVAGLVLADDSGLQVDALDGAPGVRSARYAGENATDAENRELLLRELAHRSVRGRERSARFRCVLALAEGGVLVCTFEGAVEGVIINAPRGAGGFGYDSLFVPDGYCEA